MKVLIADDDPAFLFLLEDSIVEWGYDVVSVADGNEALDVLNGKESPSLALVDWMMPGLDGVALCRRIKGDKNRAFTYLILLTSKQETKDVVQGLDAGADDFLKKPVNPEELKSRLAVGARTVRYNELLRKIFGRYLSDEIVDTLLNTESGLTLGGELREMTILTSDIRGFTDKTAKSIPEKIIKGLNFYLEAMGEVIDEYQGTINEFMGDGILVYFGAPILREDDPERAVACALAMQLAMEKVNKQLTAWGLEPWEMGIGINTGEVVVGNIGSEKRTKYSALGHEVNLTYRIESYTVGEQIFISESTLKKVGDIVKIHSEEKVFPKGSKHPITICDVRGIGGRYNIDLPEKEEVFVSLLDEVPLKFAVLEGKHISEQVLSGRLHKISNNGALIVCEDISNDLMPEAMTNLKLNLSFPGEPATDHDVYAKVLGLEDNTLRVQFTSISTEIRSQLKAMRTVS